MAREISASPRRDHSLSTSYERYSYLLLYTIYRCPLLPKAKKSITVDGQLAAEIDSYRRQLVKKAAESGARIPSDSNVYEEIIRRGWAVVKREGKK